VTFSRLASATLLLCALQFAASIDVWSAPSMPSAAGAAEPDVVRLAQAQPAQDPAPPAATDTAAAPVSPEPIGNVASLTGTVTVIRNKDSLQLKLRDDIFLNDVVQTAGNSSLGITFDDGTTFRLSANAKITIDNYVYEDDGKQNAAIFNIGRGTVAFIAASVAKTGDMKIDTPTATLGIRGTTGLVEVPDDASAASASNVAIKLYPDADGHVGRIEVNDHSGARLGALIRGASGFAIRPGAAGAGPMRFTAMPLAIAAREMQRDRGFVREVHTAQSVGRRIVTEQRAFRRANPGLAPNRGNPQRPNSAPGNRQGERQGERQPGARPQQPTQPGRQDRRGDRQERPQQISPVGQQGRPGQQQPMLPGRQDLPGRQGLQPSPGQTTQAPAQARPGGMQRINPQLQRLAPQRGRFAPPLKGRRRNQPQR
jgi:hypothetical protein